MSIAPYIKEIGRGKEGARSLTAEQAHELMSQVLDGQASDLEIGAFAIAMRIKGESIEELAGFLRSVHERCIPLHPTQPSLVLPSYNGARKLPNLTALLALLLAQEGVPVLVHGPEHDPGRVTTAEIFHTLGLPIAQDSADIHAAWARREPVFIRTEALCPPLARLLDAARGVSRTRPRAQAPTGTVDLDAAIRPVTPPAFPRKAPAFWLLPIAAAATLEGADTLVPASSLSLADPNLEVSSEAPVILAAQNIVSRPRPPAAARRTLPSPCRRA